MMNSNVKVIISLTVGAASGALVTYKLLKDKYEKDMHDEVEYLKAYYEKYPPNTKVTTEKSADEEEWIEMTEEEYEASLTVTEDKIDKESVKEYIKLYKQKAKEYYMGDKDPADEEFPTEEDEEEEILRHCEEIYRSGVGVYVVSADDFNNGMPHYDKITISYYDGDDTLADEQEEIITDIEAVVGDDALTKFGYLSGDQDIVFVRNENLSIDYEVIRVFSSYSETVLGIVDRPASIRRRRNGET